MSTKQKETAEERHARLTGLRGEHYQFQMFSTEANDTVAAAVAALVKRCTENGVSRNDLPAEVRKMQKAVSRAGFVEVFDTEPEWAIVDEITFLLCTPQGWMALSREEL